MNKSISQNLKKWISGKSGRYAAPEALVDGLRRKDDTAIEYIIAKTGGLVRQMVRQSGQPIELAKDLLVDGTIILIEKICDGVFDLAKAQPQTYLVGICRKLLANELRKRSPQVTLPIDWDIEIPDDDWIRKIERQELAALIDEWLKTLGEPCSGLVRLKYLDGYSDQEQIDLNLTTYTSLDSLKTTRCNCMKKLAEIAKNWRKKHHGS